MIDNNTSERKPLILIAEDVESNYKLLEIILKKEYNLLWAKNGKEAVEYALAEHPDAVLMDIKMPVMDGYAATCKIRELSSDVPILALSAFAFDEEKEEAKCCRFNDYLVKPVDIPLLKYKIKYYLNKK